MAGHRAITKDMEMNKMLRLPMRGGQVSEAKETGYDMDMLTQVTVPSILPES